ncbi:MAG: PqqD family protein [Candidatus Promineifilaceae bacterium]|nr:PqqD family protein [Chloroflexota bacterium]
MTPETILSRSPKATYEVVAGEAILIHLDTGAYFSLNAIGTEFWQMLDGQQTIRDHATTVANKYAVDVSMVVADLLELADKMAPEDLVVNSEQ